MSTETVSDASADADPDPDNVAQRPASTLLLAGTGLSLVLALSAVVGLSPTDSGPANALGASQGPTDSVGVHLTAPETGPLAIDRTGVGGVTIDETATASLAGPPPAALGAANSGALPAGSAAARPQVSFTPAISQRPITAGGRTEADSFTSPANSADASTGAFGDGRMGSGDDAPAAARSGAAGAGIGGGNGAAKAGNGAGGNAGSDDGNQSDGDSPAGKGPGAGGGPGPGGAAGAGGGAGPGGDDAGDSDGHGGGGHGGHGGGHHGR